MSLAEEIQACTKCGLHKLLPEPCKPIPYFGPPKSEIMIIGECPGEEEVILEEPFVGQCGQLLTKMLEESGFNRKKVVICNTVKCRSTDDGKKNRPLKTSEINTCSPWLFKEIELFKPKLIMTLGKVPAKVLLKLKTSVKMDEIFGKKFAYNSSVVVPCYHPSFLMIYSRKFIDKQVQLFKELHSEFCSNV